MPTGYTADVANGTVADFRTFALRCARAFGATIMQRDEAMDVPPRLREVSPYYAEKAATAAARLADVRAMTVAEAEARAHAEYREAAAAWRESMRERAETRNRYNTMFADVIAWEPPTPEHADLKEFMLSQLRDSRQSDCDYDWPQPTRMAADVWLADARAHAERDAAYYATQQREEEARVADANAWITALYQSLGAPAPVAGPRP